MAAAEEEKPKMSRPTSKISTSVSFFCFFQNSNLGIVLELEKKAFTKFMMGSLKVSDAAAVLQEVFVKDSDDPKNHSVDAAALVPL